MPKRNWRAIGEISDYFLRMAVSHVSDPELLKKFHKGFPELFTAGDDEGPMKIPLSELVKNAKKYSMMAYPEIPEFWNDDANFLLDKAGEVDPELSLPASYRWGRLLSGEQPPEEILGQLVGQKAEAGMTVKVESRTYLVLTLELSPLWTLKPEIGKKFIDAPLPQMVDQLILVDADLIDFNW